MLTLSQCPECAAPVTTAPHTLLGEILTCVDCQAELEVIGHDPLEFALAPEVEEDWGE